jgi:drug/metabolite transporter (DMT)-like permease
VGDQNCKVNALAFAFLMAMNVRMATASDNFRAAGYMSLSMAGFVLNDTMIKIVSENLSLFQAIFLRGFFATTFVAMMAWHQGVLFYNVSKHDRHILGLRMIGEVGGTLCFLTALFNMPIANATAILQVLPLVITLASAIFFKEAVGWRRYTAIIVGFIGVLIVVRPGSDGFNSTSFWALLAVLFMAGRDLFTRKLSSDVPSLYAAVIAALGITVIAGLLLPTMEWRPVFSEHLWMLVLAACFLVVGYIFSIMAMRVGDISFASPFRYTNLIWAIIIGLFVFGDTLDIWTLTGGLIVVATGVYTFYRDRQLNKSAAAIKSS